MREYLVLGERVSEDVNHVKNSTRGNYREIGRDQIIGEPGQLRDSLNLVIIEGFEQEKVMARYAVERNKT